MQAFTTDPTAVAVGRMYLHCVGPFFGFFGAGFALYCAAQGAGRMELPLVGAFGRSTLALGGGLMAVTLGGLFLAVGIGMAVFGLIGLQSLLFRVGFVPRVQDRASRTTASLKA
jgi:Na+-driven multidrug efflux pump